MIHPTAIIDPKAELDPTVEVGPFCVIEAGVRIGAGSAIGPYVHIQGLTTIGVNNRIGTGATIGHPPQHVEYRGAPTSLIIGDNNVIREGVSLNRAFKEGDATTIGSSCFLMGYSHVGHDSHIGNNVIIANGALVAGHVTVGDRTFVSGNVMIHQFTRVGRFAMLQGGVKVVQDAPPFMIIAGEPCAVRTINKVGLERGGLSREARLDIKRLYKALYRSGKNVSDAIAELDLASLTPEGRELVDFYKTTTRGVLRFQRYSRGAREEE